MDTVLDRVTPGPGSSTLTTQPMVQGIDADYSRRGATNYVTSGYMQEFGHSIGLVLSGAPGGVSSGYGAAHTGDYRDYMNAGYFYPGTRCDNVPTTFKDRYVDCGRDTYWDPTPTTGEWLCSHYNVATDSLYFSPLATRPLTCPPA